MPNVAKWLKLAVPPTPLDRKCDFGQYKGRKWNTIWAKDPDWILWLITDSSVLLDREVESALLSEIKKLTPD